MLQYNIKKKEEVQEIQQEEPNPLMRKKKTPEELAAEAEAEDEDEFTSKFRFPTLFSAYEACYNLITEFFPLNKLSKKNN